MRPGNLSQTVWRRSILKQLHKEKDRAFLKISEAEMCTALPIDADHILLTADEAVCGNTASIGYYAAIKVVTDLLTRGGTPKLLRARIGFPSSAEEKDVQALVKEVREVCETHRVLFAGIRAEVVPSLSQTMIQITGEGTAKKESVLHLENVAAGQEIILCGSLALEGMERILDECEEGLSERFVPAFLRQMKRLKGNLDQSEAIRAAAGYVNAMQPIGSGGILAALWEVAEAAEVGLKADMSDMSILQETIEVCEFYRLNPYQMTSAGGILMFTDQGARLTELMKKAGARTSRIGCITAEKARVLINGTETRFLDRPAPDELAIWQTQRMKQTAE